MKLQNLTYEEIDRRIKEEEDKLNKYSNSFDCGYRDGFYKALNEVKAVLQKEDKMHERGN